MPFGEEAVDEVCPVCGKKSVTTIFWGKAY